MKGINQAILARVTLLLFALLPIVDVVNAQLLSNSSSFGNVSQYFKLVVVAVLFTFYLSKQQKLLVGVITLFFTGISLFHYYSVQQSNALLIDDVIFFGKIIAIPVFIWGITALVGKVAKKEMQLLTYVLFLTWGFYVLNVIASLAGLATSQYSSGIGLKGYFFSGNEFSVAYLLLAAVGSVVLLNEKKYVKFLLFSVITTVFAVAIGFKTAIFGVTIVIITATLFFSYRALLPALKRKSALWASFVLGLIVVGMLLLEQQGFIARAQRHLNIGVVHYITGSRDEVAQKSVAVFSQLPIEQQLFGIGRAVADQKVGQLLGVSEKSSEIDPVDLLLYGGAVSLFLVYGVWIVSLTAIFLPKCTPQKRYFLFVSFLLLVISSLAGHVIYAGLAIPYWGLLAAVTKKYEQEQYAIKKNIIFLGSMAGGGIRTYMLNTAEEMRLAGEVVTVIPTHYPTLVKTIASFPGNILTFFWVVLRASYLGYELVFHYHMATKGSFVRKFILATVFWPFSNVQVIHLHAGKSASFFGNMAKGLAGQLLLKFFFSLFTNVVFVSETLRRETIDSLSKISNIQGIQAKVAVLPNAIRVHKAITRADFVAGNRLKLLFVGRLTGEKNLPLLMEIATLLASKKVNYSLQIVGDGPGKEYVTDAIQQNALESQVQLSGWATQAQLQQIYCENHLLLVTSSFESFGLVALEALNLGMPVLATRVGGLQEVVESDVNGYVFDKDNATAFVEKIIELTAEPDKLQQLSVGARETVKKYAYNEHINKLVKIYDNRQN